MNECFKAKKQFLFKGRLKAIFQTAFFNLQING